MNITEQAARSGKQGSRAVGKQGDREAGRLNLNADVRTQSPNKARGDRRWERYTLQDDA